MNVVAEFGSLVGTARRVGFFDPFSAGALATATAAWGPTIAAGYAAGAARHPNRIAVVDDHGMLTYRQLERRAGRVAVGLRRIGVARGTPVGILCRNHRGFIEAAVALAKLGGRAVLLNPTLPAAQLESVVRAESVSVVIADRDLVENLGGLVDGDGEPIRIVVAAPEDDDGWSFPDLKNSRGLIGIAGPTSGPTPILLTSGTTGAPKGTRRTVDIAAAVAALGVMETIPYTKGDVVVLPAPLFHAWGFSQLVLASSLADTVILRRRFEPRQTLDDLEAHGATVLAAVPVLLHRLLEQRRVQPAEEDRDLTSLRVVATSGSALPGDLAVRWMDSFGDTLYNLYGSTEIGQVSVATPADLRATPDSAGRALRGVHIEVLDDDDSAVPPGTIGEVMVASGAGFDGYSDGSTKRRVGELMSTGDRGYVDADGRLFIVGRTDDMIISGGENVYPSVIERSLLDHDAVHEVAVVGVADTELGQRVRAVVVVDGPVGAALTGALKNHARAALASHEVPREFVAVTSLPRNAAGKVLRAELSGPKTKVPNRRSALRKKPAGRKSVKKPTADERDRS